MKRSYIAGEGNLTSQTASQLSINLPSSLRIFPSNKAATLDFLLNGTKAKSAPPRPSIHPSSALTDDTCLIKHHA